jgi:hypothetical protein
VVCGRTQNVLFFTKGGSCPSSVVTRCRMQAAATKDELQTFLTERGTMYVREVVIKYEHRRVRRIFGATNRLTAMSLHPPPHPSVTDHKQHHSMKNFCKKERVTNSRIVVSVVCGKGGGCGCVLRCRCGLRSPNGGKMNT